MYKIVYILLLICFTQFKTFAQLNPFDSGKYTLVTTNYSYFILFNGKKKYVIKKRKISQKIYKEVAQNFKVVKIGIQKFNNDDFKISNNKHSDIFLFLFIFKESSNENYRIVYDPKYKKIIEIGKSTINPIE